MYSSARVGPDLRRVGTGRPARSSSDSHARHVVSRQRAQAVRHVGRHQHTDADRFAVQPFDVAGGRFDRVTERVAEIQQRALALLALVAPDDLRLDLAGTKDRVRQRSGLLALQGIDVLLEPFEERAIADQAVLDDLGQPGVQFARGQRLEHIGVGQHLTRLMKRTDHVLAARMIDGGLAAHGGIDLRQQRRRHLHEIDAALVAGRDEAGEVADHAAAERQHQRVASETVGDQHVEHAARRGERLVLFAVRQNHFDNAPIRERGANRRCIQRRNDRVADQQDVACRQRGLQQRVLVQESRPDDDRIRAIFELYGECLHAAARVGAASITGASAGRSRPDRPERSLRRHGRRGAGSSPRRNRPFRGTAVRAPASALQAAGAGRPC